MVYMLPGYTSPVPSYTSYNNWPSYGPNLWNSPMLFADGSGRASAGAVPRGQAMPDQGPGVSDLVGKGKDLYEMYNDESLLDTGYDFLFGSGEAGAAGTGIGEVAGVTQLGGANTAAPGTFGSGGGISGASVTGGPAGAGLGGGLAGAGYTTLGGANTAAAGTLGAGGGISGASVTGGTGGAGLGGGAGAGGAGAAGLSMGVLGPAAALGAGVLYGLYEGFTAPNDPGAGFYRTPEGLLEYQAQADDAPSDRWNQMVSGIGGSLNERIQAGELELPENMQPVYMAGNPMGLPTEFASYRSGYGLDSGGQWGDTTLTAPISESGFESLLASSPNEINRDVLDSRPPTVGKQAEEAAAEAAQARRRFMR